MVHNRDELLREWDSDLRLICHGHYDAAVQLDRQHYTLGVPVVVLSAAIGTLTFATFGKQMDTIARITVGLGSLVAAVLASLQTFMKYPERAEMHRKAGARFGSLLKEMEQKTGSPSPSDVQFAIWADAFRARWDQISQESPTIPRRIWARHYAKNKLPIKSTADPALPAN